LHSGVFHLKSKRLVLATWSVFVAQFAWAESGRLNFNADLGLETPVSGRFGTYLGPTLSGQAYGVKLLLAADYQIKPPFALEFSLGLGPQFVPAIINQANGSAFASSTVATFFVGVGPRFRFLDDSSGYLNEKASAAGNLWASLHVGLHGYDGVRFGVDAAAGYQFSLHRPFSIGPFVRAALLFDDGPRGANFLVTIGAAASFEIVPLTVAPDSDGDGLSDESETSNHLTDPRRADTDGDGLFDGLEIDTRTNPREEDTDGDGMGDGQEDKNQNGRVDRGETDPRKADKVKSADPSEEMGIDLTEPSGVADEDSDGVSDSQDQCPRTAARLTVDAKGCVVIGKAFVLEGVTFASGKSAILPESARVLEQALETLKKNPKISVEIGGHTDNQGRPAANLTLSKARAEAVKAWLVKNGLPAKRITGTKGYGASKPRAGNDSAEGRAKNRRIEFRRSDG
jgi:outer membrane protein OmpA-like peptidoglycan-associated protein